MRPQELHKRQEMIRTNKQAIKLYISESSQLIPDIVNQCEQISIYSHFKFFFNDDQLMLKSVDSLGDFVSLMHQQSFQEQLNLVFQQWRKNIMPNNQHNNSLLVKKVSQNSQNQVNQVLYHNFIAFIDYWIDHSPNLIVYYAPYVQIIKQSVEQFIQNKIYQIAFSVTEVKKPFKLKHEIKKNAKNRKQLEQQSNSLDCSLIQKRLIIYFNHFAKLQNLSSNITYNNKSKTFDQIQKSFSSINLQQWICFIKFFHFDKIFQQIHKQKDLKGQTQKNKKNYLPVKSVRWSNSLQYFKTIFQKFCDGSKQLNFKAYLLILTALFKQIFNKQSISLLKNNKDLIHNTGEELTNQERSFQKIGINYLKLTKQQYFKINLRSLGVFVPETIVVLQNKKSVCLNKVKAKYLNLPSLPLISNSKINKGKQDRAEVLMKSIITPQIKKQKCKIYTIDQLMCASTVKKQKKQHNGQLEIDRSKSGKKTLVQNEKTKHNLSMHEAKKQILHELKDENIKKEGVKRAQSKIARKTEIKSSYVSSLQQQYQNETDQYLNKYYQKTKQVNLSESSNIKNPNKNVKLDRLAQGKQQISNKKTYPRAIYLDNNKQVDNYLNKNSFNIMRRLDDRIQKIHHKLL